MELVALHNLTPASLRRVAALGALPMPSIAVLPLANRFGPYGKISLVAPLDLADPSVDPAVRLYDGDVYTPRDPRAHEEETDIEAILARMREVRFYDEYPAGFFPLGRFRSRFCRELGSMSEALEAAARIVPREDFDRAEMAAYDRFEPLLTETEPYHAFPAGEEPPSWEAIGRRNAALMRGLARAAGGERRDLVAALRQEGYTGLPRRLVDRLVRFSKHVADCPAPYFEAKVDRAVRLDEFLAATIPADSDPDIEGILTAAGIGIVVRCMDDDRAKAVAEAVWEIELTRSAAPVMG